MENYGKRNRKVGHDAERHFAREFREMGFSKCITSRKGSRLFDDAAIDLIFIPFNVQIKAGKQRGLNPVNILREIDERIKKYFPKSHEVHNLPNILIVRKFPGQGVKRDEYHDTVIMSFESFKKIINTNYDKYKE